jgi:uncharacterized UPF0160 family protein
MNTNTKIKLVTHNGSFHTDDVFAAAALSMLFEKQGKAFEMIRTRDEAEIELADIVFDVGGIYDESKNRFDHHQVGGAGKRNGGIEYASFGLVWKKFGEELAGSKEAQEFLDQKLAAPIDAFDNGFDLVTNKFSNISPYYLQHIIFTMHPTWREEQNHDEIFKKAVEFAKEVLKREIIQTKDSQLAEKEIKAIYEQTKDKRIIVLDQNYPAQYVLHDFPEPLFIIYPRSTNNYWGVKTVRTDPKTFNNRKNLPSTWAGLRDEELQNITGVPDAVFCHKALFLVVAKTREGAIKLAEVALRS